MHPHRPFIAFEFKRTEPNIPQAGIRVRYLSPNGFFVLPGQILLVLGMVLCTGCGSYVFYRADIPQSPAMAGEALEVLAQNPAPLQRPLLLIHGWRDSARRWEKMLHWLRRCTTNAEEMVVVFDYSGDQPISVLTEELFRKYKVLGEVDVVGHSMGGLIAREAHRRGFITIKTLFSMASPHRGSYLARYGPLFRQLRDMTPGSEFLRRLNSDPRTRDFNIITYWMRGDFLLTQGSSESLGGTNVILSTGNKPLFRYTHNQLVMDERTIYDVIRRLTCWSVERACPPEPEVPPAIPPTPPSLQTGVTSGEPSASQDNETAAPYNQSD